MIHLKSALCVACALLSIAGRFAHAESHEPGPAGLSPSEWTGIRAAYEANRHAAFAVEGGFIARNPGQRWRTRFDGHGFMTTPESGDWSWGLETVGYACGDALRSVTTPMCIDAQGNRVAYHWDETLTEWYVNDPRGLEHGYTVHHRPGGIDRRDVLPPLQITLAVCGDLLPRGDSDGRNVTFISADGAAMVNYNALTVFDATGAEVPAWFESSKSRDAVKSTCTNPQSQFVHIVVDDSNAVYPLTIDPIAQQAYLKASNTDASDNFGCSVAASGDTVVVGAYGESSSATGVNGNQADNSAPVSGAAYVFVRDENGVWTQQAYLKASNTAIGDYFGFSVAVSGDTVVVGAWNEDSNATGVNGNQANNSATLSGAAYVFVRDESGVWTQQAYLKASNTGGGDQFGESVAVSGDTVLVGAKLERSNATGVNGNQADNSANIAGAAYVFVRDAQGTWTQQAYLKASNTGAGDQFGESVAVWENTAVVGAPGEDSNATGVDGDQNDNSVTGAGAAYVFIRSGTTWTQQAYLKSSNTGAEDHFGDSVAVGGDTVVVGAYLEDSGATGVDGNQADNSVPDSGAAYVFFRSGTTWSQQAYLKASNTGFGDHFGESVTFNGDSVVVGAPFEASSTTGVDGDQADNSAFGSGAVYAFLRESTMWSQQAYLKASNTGTNNQFGVSVSVSGDTVVVGALGEESNAVGVNGNEADNSAANSGAAYVFTGLGPPDSDGDGVTDVMDVCPNNSPGLPIDCAGRPLRDCNNDCLVDGADVQCIVDEMLNQ